MDVPSRSASLSVVPPEGHRTSVSSRLSSAVSIAERGEITDGEGVEAQHEIEEEIAKIKRYEVRDCLFCYKLAIGTRQAGRKGSRAFTTTD